MGVAEKMDQMILQAEEKVAALQNLKAEIQSEIDAAHTKGYEEGRAEQGTDLIYTQAEYEAGISAAVETAVAPLNEQINQAQVNYDELNNSIPTQIEDSKKALKAELLAEYEAAQVAETDSETGFKNKLNS